MVYAAGISENLKPGNLGDKPRSLDPGGLGGSPLSQDPGTVGN
ncbi:hypothetical protein ACQKGI_20065 [Peribacillus muralis]